MVSDRLRGSPTLDTLAIIVVVFCLQQAAGVLSALTPLNLFGLFVATPRGDPVTTVLSVYAHGGPGHLVGNALALALVGFAIERATTRLRYHAFFLAAGIVSALAQVYATGGAVLGASGAIFALYGYVVTGNPVSRSVLDAVELPTWAQVGIFVAIAGGITWLTASPGVALVGHFAGLLFGLAAGRGRLLTVLLGDGADDRDDEYEFDTESDWSTDEYEFR
jgi:membrane associated rhomboid family serine protease